MKTENQVSQLAVELRALVWDDATDMMQGAMAGCPVECLAFAKWWIQRAKGLPTEVPGDYPVFRQHTSSESIPVDSGKFTLEETCNE